MAGLFGFNDANGKDLALINARTPTHLLKEKEILWHEI
jgi:hypothetical protein